MDWNVFVRGFLLGTYLPHGPPHILKGVPPADINFCKCSPLRSISVTWSGKMFTRGPPFVPQITHFMKFVFARVTPWFHSRHTNCYRFSQGLPLQTFIFTRSSPLGPYLPYFLSHIFARDTPLGPYLTHGTTKVL